MDKRFGDGVWDIQGYVLVKDCSDPTSDRPRNVDAIRDGAPVHDGDDQSGALVDSRG